MHEPKIYLIASPKLVIEEIDRFLKDRSLSWARSDDSTDSSDLVEIAGRLCYLSFTDDRSKIRFPVDKYIQNLINKGHESVLEHATWTFIIDRVSRAFTHQLVRHRIGFSFSQLSQQYHDESDAAFVPPEGLADRPLLYSRWQNAIAAAQSAYREILYELSQDSDVSDPETRRWLRSAARSLLPNATETAIAVTANARSLRHFFEVRGATIGDPEMRQVSVKLLNLVSEEAPALFADFEVVATTDEIGRVVKRNTE